MTSPVWRFREKQRAEVHQDPANTEFFAQQDVAERLVREAAQNSMDAVRNGSAAELSFRFVTAPASAWPRYFGSLRPHLESLPELDGILPTAGESVPVLLIEDYPDGNLTRESLARAVLLLFFYPILSRRQTVLIEEADHRELLIFSEETALEAISAVGIPEDGAESLRWGVRLARCSLTDGLGMPWSSRDFRSFRQAEMPKTDWHQLNAEPHYVVRNINAGTDTQKAQKRGDS